MKNLQHYNGNINMCNIMCRICEICMKQLQIWNKYEDLMCLRCEKEIDDEKHLCRACEK